LGSPPEWREADTRHTKQQQQQQQQFYFYYKLLYRKESREHRKGRIIAALGLTPFTTTNTTTDRHPQLNQIHAK
jgi:hypothetical protein